MFVVKVPGINGVSDTLGCRNSGNNIIKELRKISRNEQGKIIDVNLLDLEEIHVDNSDLKNSDKLIHASSLKMFESYPKTIFLGGDHSISYSLANGFFKHCSSNGKIPCLIVFDSMPNCNSKSKNSFPDNENWLRKTIENGFPGENVLIVGARSYKDNEADFIKSNKIKTISMNQFTEDIHETCDFLMEFSNGKETYVSLDLSVLDPPFAPSSTHHEPGGFTSRELVYILQRINKIKNIRGFDIVEVNSELDSENNHLTAKVGAKILSEII